MQIAQSTEDEKSSVDASPKQSNLLGYRQPVYPGDYGEMRQFDSLNEGSNGFPK